MLQARTAPIPHLSDFPCQSRRSRGCWYSHCQKFVEKLLVSLLTDQPTFDGSSCCQNPRQRACLRETFQHLQRLRFLLERNRAWRTTNPWKRLCLTCTLTCTLTAALHQLTTIRSTVMSYHADRCSSSSNMRHQVLMQRGRSLYS